MNLVSSAPRQLGDVEIAPLGLGCWRLVAMPVTDAQAVVESALDAGMNLIDTADVYGLDWGGQAFGEAEALFGQILQQAPSLRDRMILATKGGIVPGVPYDSSRLRDACEESLTRLRTESVDLYQIHRPDLLTHPEEVARILEDLNTSGKIGAVGVSNFTPHQVDALQAYLSVPIVSQQPEYSALHLDPLFNGTFDQCMTHRTAVLAWSPLAGGQLAQAEGLSQELGDVLRSLADRESTDVATIALAFTMAHPSNPVALVGSTNPERIRASMDALKVSLDRNDVYQIIQASMGESLP